jgi:hypothetical protein
MKFTIGNKQTTVSIDEDFWKRAFNFAARELQIEHHCAEVDCLFIPMEAERKIKFTGAMSLGATGLAKDGAWFYVVATPGANFLERTFISGNPRNYSQMVKTFFHEMTHVKQLLMGELILKPRCWMWKGEKWDRREYSFAPWEVEAQTFADKAYAKFQQGEVSRVMRDDDVHAYHPSVMQLCHMFPKEEVLCLTQEVYKERERQALLSSGRD